ncbi:unnamed protein product, partial [Phaeothamnion confervicola]
MTIDMGALQRACRTHDLTGATHLCRAGLDQFRTTARDGNLTVACTQEAPLFREIAGDEGLAANLSFVNIRETAGWSSESASATPKIAALLALSRLPQLPQQFVAMESEGVTLLLGRDEHAIEVANALSDTLDITVLLTGESEVAPPDANAFPIRRGIARTASGHLGAFDLTVDGYAEPAPSSRAAFRFGPQRNGLKSRADIIIDISGRPPLFSAPQLREGYLRA